MERIKRAKKKMTEETKQKIREGNKGKIVSEETKAKLKAARKNFIYTDETKQAISVGLKKYWANVIWVNEKEENKELNDNLKDE
jgi:hypothetical protein